MWWLLTAMAGCVGIVLWEHVGRLHHWALRPSVPLEWVAQKCEYLWHQLGVLVGHLSGIWDWLYRHLLDHLQDLIITVEFLGHLLGRIVLSPLQFVWGYTETFRSYLYGHIVLIGSVLSLVVVGGGLEYWYWNSQWSEQVQVNIKFASMLLVAALVLVAMVWYDNVGATTGITATGPARAGTMTNTAAENFIRMMGDTPAAAEEEAPPHRRRVRARVVGF